MHSELFSIGPFTLRMFGVCMAIGFFVGWQILVYLCRVTGRSSDRLINLLVLEMVCSVSGARIAHVIENWSTEFAANPWLAFRIDQGGLMFYGGLIASILTLVVYTRITKESFIDYADLIATVIPLGHMFGRLGCFMNGCCYGQCTNAWYGVAFPKGSPAWWEQLNAGAITTAHVHSMPVIPTQLFEAAANFFLFLPLIFLYPRMSTYRGFISGLYLVGYALLRFVIEYFRGDPRAAVGPFSISQTISIAMLLFGLGLILYAWRGTRTTEEHA